MKAKGLRRERETVIRFSDADAIAEVETYSNRIYKTLLARGYLPMEDLERSATFRIPKNCVTLRRSIPISKKKLDGLAKARSKIRRQSDQNSLTVQ